MATKKTVKKSNKETILEKKPNDTKTKKEKNIKESEVLDSAKEQYFTISLDTFLYNAGIVGFIKVLEAAGAKEGDSIDNKKDYFIDGQDLYASKEFLLNPKTDLAQAYIDGICEKFRKDTFFEKIKNEKVYKKELSTINSQYQINEKTGKIKGGKYRQAISKIGMVLNHDYESEILSLDNNSRLDKIKQILSYVEKDNVSKSILNFNSVTGKITAFWGQFAFLDYANTSKYQLSSIIEKYFTNSIKNMIADKSNLNIIANCFMCSNKIYENYAYESLGQKSDESNSNKKKENKKYYNTSFINGLSQNLNDKSSHFWNYKPDVDLCPLCAFIYACVPLGFIDVGYSTFIFINKNCGIQDILIEINEYQINNKIEDKNKPNFFHSYIKSKINKKEFDFDGIEFVINEMLGKNYRYTIKNIDRNVLTLLDKSVSDIAYIYINNKNYQLSNKDNLDIFNECVNNILSNRNQYNLINKILYSKIKIKNKDSFLIDDIQIIKIIFSVLKIQIYKNTIFIKEENMATRIEKAKEMCKAGDRLRREIAKSMDIYNYKSDNKVSDKVKSISFKLAGTVRAGNATLFLDIASQIYTSLGADFPTLFVDMLNSLDEFKELGHAYIIGLQNGYEKENKKEGEKNEE